MSDKDKTLLLIDSHALIYRAYFAMPPTLTTSDGEPVNAVFGFASLLLEVLLKIRPTNVIAVMDSKGPTFRNEMYVAYKANRKEADELFIAQLPRVVELIKAFDIPVLAVPGYEADDIIATIDAKHSGAWAQTIVVTGDKDLFQLVDEDTFVYLAGSKFSASKLYGENEVFEKMGIKPSQVTDYKSIAGDPSDNIPGVKGIGEKGAIKLISQFGSLENLYQEIEHVEPRYQKKLIENSEIAFLSKRLATVEKDAPISFDFATSSFDTFDFHAVDELFDYLQFRSLKGKLENLANNMNVVKKEEQLSFQTEAKVSKILEWDEQSIESDTVFCLPVMHKDNSPVNIRISDLYFTTSSEDSKVWRVNENKIKKFATSLEGKKFVTVDEKKILHAYSNSGIECDGINFIDLGVEVAVVSCGQASGNLEGVFNFFRAKLSEVLSENVLGIKNIYKNFEAKKENFDWASKVLKLENGIIGVVADMEHNGIILDVVVLKEVEQNLLKYKEKIEKSIFVGVGHEFNINSPKQVAEVLYVEKGLGGTKKTKGGAYSTNERELRKLIGVDPVVELLLKYREVDKLLSTYIKTLPSFVDSFTKKVHAIFDQTGAVSGRFSSRNPNMQNIPVGENLGVNVRDAFISDAGKIFVAFDYSQQELRILAALAKEGVMLERFNKGDDIHKATASEIFNVPIEEVTKAQRSVGKTINFSVVYGISSFGLSERLEIPRAEATMFIHKYFENYPKVKNYFEKVIQAAQEKGYVETVLGRRRMLEMKKAQNQIVRKAMEREAINFGIQGSAADIMKMAMFKLDPVLKKYDAKLILQIHDEFLFEFPKKGNLDNFVKEVIDLMENIYDIGVRYKVDAKVGERWGSMEELRVKS